MPARAAGHEISMEFFHRIGAISARIPVLFFGVIPFRLRRAYSALHAQPAPVFDTPGRFFFLETS